MSVTQPSQGVSYWALHLTHVIISAIVFVSLIAYTYIVEIVASAPMPGEYVTTVWIVVGPTAGFFISRIKAPGISVVTTAQQTQPTVAATNPAT